MNTQQLVHWRKLLIGVALTAGLSVGCGSTAKPETKSAEDRLLDMGVPAKLATYFGAVKIDVLDGGPDRYRYRETFPDGPSRVVTINLQHDAAHVTSETELAAGDGLYLTEYDPEPKDGAFAFKYLVPNAAAAESLSKPQSIAAPG